MPRWQTAWNSEGLERIGKDSLKSSQELLEDVLPLLFISNKINMCLETSSIGQYVVKHKQVACDNVWSDLSK